MINMGEMTRLTKATSKSDSLRTTVPKSIVSFLKLEMGEVIEWEMEIKNNQRVAVVRCIKKDQS